MLHVNFIQVKDSEDMGKAAADEFEAVIQAKPSCVIGLAPVLLPFRCTVSLFSVNGRGSLTSAGFGR